MSKFDKFVTRLMPFGMIVAVVNITNSYIYGSRVGYFFHLLMLTYLCCSYYYRKQMEVKIKTEADLK